MTTKKKAKDYEAIASEKIRKPSEAAHARKILVYARNKVGKTGMCMSAPGVLIADPEHGTDPYIRQDPDVWPIEQWDDLDDFYRFARTGKHDYEWFALDGMTRMHNMALRKVMKLQEDIDLNRIPGLVRRQDYGKANELTKGMMYNWLQLPYGVIFTAQERKIQTTFEDEEEDLGSVQIEYVPDLPAGARKAVNEVADIIGRLYVQKVKVRAKGEKEIKVKNQRRLHIGPHEQYDTGYRSDFDLPDMVRNPTVPKLVSMLMGQDEG